MINFFSLIRLKDWVKNIIIFLPLVFTGNLTNIFFYYELFLTFVLFSLSSTFIYIINDIIDVEEDRLHPLKVKKKPLASKKISIKFAIVVLVIIFFILFIGFTYFNKIFYHLIFYIFVNILYTFLIKRIPILDVLLVCFGYIVRLDVGSLVIETNTSIFLALTIFFLANFIVFIKRLIQIKNHVKSKNLSWFYSFKNLKILIFFSSLLFFITLVLFILQKKIELLVLIPILIFIFIRYYKSSLSYNLGEYPLDLVVKDKLILLSSLLVICYTIFIYY